MVSEKTNNLTGGRMKRFMFLCMFLLIVPFLMFGCDKPPEVIPPDGTSTIVAVPAALTAAINAGCTASKTYILVDSQWLLIRPFIPATILPNVIVACNVFQKSLNLYNAAVIAWSNNKTEPTNFAQLKADIKTAQEALMPLIAQIAALMHKAKSPETSALKAIDEINSNITEKGIFSCTIDEFKAIAAQLKALPVLS